MNRRKEKLPPRKWLARRKMLPSLVVMTCAVYGWGWRLGRSGDRGNADSTGVLKKVNKFKFGLFSWIQGVQWGWIADFFRGSLTFC